MLWDILCQNVCHFVGQEEATSVACILWTYTKPKVKAVVVTWTGSHHTKHHYHHWDTNSSSTTTGTKLCLYILNNSTNVINTERTPRKALPSEEKLYIGSLQMSLLVKQNQSLKQIRFWFITDCSRKVLTRKCSVDNEWTDISHLIMLFG